MQNLSKAVTSDMQNLKSIVLKSCICRIIAQSNIVEDVNGYSDYGNYNDYANYND